MGTNFYLGKKPCCECGLSPDKIHLGKRSAGWKFLVRGYRWDNEIGVPVSSCLGMLKMVSDLRESGWTVFDEYGSEYLAQDFEKVVYDTKDSGCHYKAIKDGGHDMTDDSLDGEGWSITYREFS